MRTKEVEKAFIKLYEEKIVLQNSINKANYDEKYRDEIDLEDFEELKQAIETVLAYIEELEQENKKYKNFQVHIYGMRSGKELLTRYINDSVLKDEIRDKIKELELEEDRIYKLDYELEREKAIDVVISKRVLLKSLLGE